jgi:hypothetical protein
VSASGLGERLVSADDYLELVRNDPESEAQFELLRDIAEEELTVRLALGQRIETPADVRGVAELIADAILDAFAVRRRPPDEPRSSVRKREG